MANHQLAEELADELDGKEIVTGIGQRRRSWGTVTGHNGGGYLTVDTRTGQKLRSPENVQTMLKGSARTEGGR